MSLDLLAADIRLLVKGMKDATGELVNNKSNELLKDFCLDAEPRVTKLQEDLETAKVNPKWWLFCEDSNFIHILCAGGFW